MSNYKEWLEKRNRERADARGTGCPICGNPITYRGFSSVECGADSDCPNFRLQPVPEPKKFLYLQAMLLLKQGFRVRFRSKRDADGKPYSEYCKDWLALEPSEYMSMTGLPPDSVDPHFEFEQVL